MLNTLQSIPVLRPMSVKTLLGDSGLRQSQEIMISPGSQNDTFEMEPNVDIIAIHGLGGMRGGWETANTCNSCNDWLRDCLPVQKMQTHGARIMTFGYNLALQSDISDSSAQIAQCAESLLDLLLRNRQTKVEVKRPLIFVAHSLGGLIIKKALLKSGGVLGYQDIVNSTSTIIFLAAGESPLRITGPEVFDFLQSSEILYKRKYIFRLLHVNRHILNLGEVCLPVVQTACIFLMDTYIPAAHGVLNDVVTYGSHLFRDPKAIEKSDGLGCKSVRLPLQTSGGNSCKSVLQDILDKWPVRIDAGGFVVICIIYGISSVTYYNLHAHHKFQQHILISCLLVGVANTLRSRLQNSQISGLTFVIPASITLALVFSILVHAILGIGIQGEEEKILRILEEWGKDLEVVHEKHICKNCPAH